jgi:hypothetical protein
MDRNLRWRTREFAERVLDHPVETVRLVEQLTTVEGEFFVLNVTARGERFWVVAEASEMVLYSGSEFRGAEDALQAHLDVGTVEQ